MNSETFKNFVLRLSVAGRRIDEDAESYLWNKFNNTEDQTFSQAADELLSGDSIPRNLEGALTTRICQLNAARNARFADAEWQKIAPWSLVSKENHSLFFKCVAAALEKYGKNYDGYMAWTGPFNEGWMSEQGTSRGLENKMTNDLSKLTGKQETSKIDYAWIDDSTRNTVEEFDDMPF